MHNRRGASSNAQVAQPTTIRTFDAVAKIPSLPPVEGAP